jgi:DNA polymerase-1
MPKATLPNIREMFIPDPDHIMFEADLKGADAQVVAWEANDEDLKRRFAGGLDVHHENAKDMFNDKELHAATPAQVKANIRLNKLRQKTKVGVHATNYGCQPPTLAASLEISFPEAIRFQDTWFRAHPGILDWHNNTDELLRTTRTVTNKFGYRRQYFDRIDNILPQALAWIPQSTVAICINKGWVALARSGLPVEVLLQVHDSIIGQFHKRHLEADPDFATKITTAMAITIPYDDPLTIPLSIKLSEKSWGACS